MLKILGFSLVYAAVLILSGCDSRNSGQDDSTGQRSQPPDTEYSLITHLAGKMYGNYACDSFRDIQPEDFKNQHLFPGVLMQRYGVEKVYVSSWTNVTDMVSGPVTVYCARFPSDLNAYGIFTSIPGGVDQTALRGRPAKRLGRTLAALKNRWMVWTLPAHADKHPLMTDYELVFSGICQELPGLQGMLPDDIRVLGKMEPAPDSIQFTPDNYMGLSFLNSAVFAKYRSKGKSVELFGTQPHTRAAGMSQLTAFKQWLADQGITAVYIENGDCVSLYIDDRSMEPVYMVVDSYGLRGVKGLNSISDAQALLARWIPE